MQRGHLIDATRIEDGLLVYIKKVRGNSDEFRIATFFSQPHIREHPRNHCVPILALLDPPQSEWTIMVMPLLRPFDNPRFVTVGAAVEFVRQLIEVCPFE